MKRLRELVGTRFARDAMVLQVATFVQGGSYLITSVLTKRYLGMDEMGRWSSARTLFVFAYFLVTVGVVSATISRYSEAKGRRDAQACVNALAAMLKIGFVAAGLVIALAFAFAPAYAEHAYHDAEVGHFAALLCVSGVFEVIRGLTVVALQGTRQMRDYAWFDIASNVLRLVLVFGALVAGWGIPGVVWAFLAHMALAGGLALYFYARARRSDPALAPPPLRDVFAAMPRARVGDIFGISYLMALNKSIDTLLPQLGMLLIPGLVALQQTGQAFRANAAYQIAYVLSWGIGLLMGGVSQALLPALGLKLGRRDVPFEQMGGTLRRVALIAGSVMMVVTLVSIPLMYLVIRFGYGAGAEDAFVNYLCLTSGNLFLGFTCVATPFYIYSGRLRLAVCINLVLGAVGAVAMTLCGRWFGPIGISLAVGLCDALGLIHLVYMWLYFRRAKSLIGQQPRTQDSP